jgi:hypothetical protein
VIVVGHILQSDEQQVADELADLVLMNALSGNDFSDLQDLRVSYLLDLLSRDEEGIYKGIENLRFNQLIHAHCSK